MPPAAVSDKTFGREVLAATTPVLVEFSAEHAPSNASLNELSGEMAGRIKIVKVDVERNPSLKDEYGVRGLPTLILFKYGKPVARRLGGLAAKAELVEWIDGALVLALAARRAAARSASDFKMANGMKVIVIPDHRAPVVTHMVLYKVGSADEPKDFAGLARFLAHLSLKSLNKIADGDYPKAISRIGGETNGDSDRATTIYWQRVPRDKLKVAMQMEADRMVTLRLSDEEVATEREVVLELRRSSIDAEPNARLIEAMNAALRGHRLPSNNIASEIAQLALADVLRFHKLHYAPNNAILVVSGDVTPAEVKLLADEIYAGIPTNADLELPRPRQERLKVPRQTTIRRVRLEGSLAETAVFGRSFCVPGYGRGSAGEAEALHVLTKILAGGVTSRLYRKLVIEDKVAAAVSSAYSSNLKDGGELALWVLTNDDDLVAVEAAVDAAIEDIRKNGVTQAELQGAKKSLVAGYIYSGSDQLTLTRRHARAAALGRTIGEVEDWATLISHASAADVLKVAKTYIVPRRSVTGWLSGKRGSKRARRNEQPGVERRFV